MSSLTPAVLTLLLLVPLVDGRAADAPPAYVPRQSDRPEPLPGDEPGFVEIFDGHTLNGWSGNPKYWRVEEGALVGEITSDTLLKSNTFIIWQGGHPKNFELKLEYRITPAGNSGINYRSARVADPVTPENAFAMRGYQFDLDGKNRYTGNNYEEKGRLFLATRGQLTHVVGGRPPVLLASLGNAAELESLQTSDWNAVHLIVRDHTLVHLLNGKVIAVVVDDDTPNRPVDGEIGVQVHVGPPMKVEYRKIRLKTFPDR